MNIYDIGQARALQLLIKACESINENEQEYAYSHFMELGFTVPELQALGALPEYVHGVWEYSDTNFRITYEITAPFSAVQLQEIADAAAAQWYDSDDGDGLPLPEYIERELIAAGCSWVELQDVKDWYDDNFMEV
jgi:hypothetical protein